MNRLDIEAPLFRPCMPAWDEWLMQHMRTRELTGRIKVLHMVRAPSACG